MSWLPFNLVASSLVLVAVLLIRRPVAALFGARAAYALWLAPLLRLVMPPLPAGASTVGTGSPGEVYWTRIVVPATEQAVPIAATLLLAWAAGAAIMLALHFFVHIRFVRRALAAGRPLLVDGVTVDVVATPAVEGPMATGLAHRLIFVPHDFERRFTPDQRRFALLHEQLHHYRGDIWASAAALVAASALWFNPFAHLALGAFRRDMEAACDASLIARTGRDQVPAYARTILASAARPVPRSLCALTSIDELKGRLTMLNANHGAGRKLAGLLLAGGVAAVGLALAAPASADEPKAQHKEVRTVIIEHDGKGPAGATWSGDPEHMKVDCPGKLTTVEADAAAGPDKKEKAKIVLCSKGGTTADQIQGIERALARINGDSDMDAGVKAQIKTKLEAKLAELRAGN